MNNSAGWITVNCHNCSSGDVYSVQRPYARVSTSLIEQATQNQFGDHILIHQGAIVREIKPLFPSKLTLLTI
jgi:hydrogenase maturation factor